MKKIIKGKDLGLSIKDIERQTKSLVAHYRKAARDLYEKGYYIRGRRMGFCNEGHSGHYDCYVLTQNKEVITLFYDTSYHRTNVIMKAILSNDKRLEKVSSYIWENYITNGYLTRRKGLFGQYEEETEQRMKKIAQSHADYIGHETGDSKIDHDNRVALRIRR